MVGRWGEGRGEGGERNLKVGRLGGGKVGRCVEKWLLSPLGFYPTHSWSLKIVWFG